MKNRNIGKICALALMFLTACQQTVLFENEEESERIPVTFTPEIQTRAVNNAWEVGDKLGVYMFETQKALSSQSIIDESANRKYVYTGEGLVPCTSNDTLFYPTNTKVDFIAYHPYRAVNNYTVDLDVTNQASQSAIDFLYSNNLKGISRTTESLELKFTHELAQVQFLLGKGEGMTDSDLKGLKVDVDEVVAEASYDLTTGTLSIASGANTTKIAANVNDAGTVGEMIMIPQTGGDKYVIVTLASRRAYKFLLKDLNWVAGNSYTYHITLNKDYQSINVLTATITPWGDGGSADLNQDGGSTLDASNWDGETIDESWYSASLSKFELTKASELAGLAKLVNEGTSFEGKTIFLMNSIDMKSENWTPIGNASGKTFKGTFNGNGHTISNINPQITSDVPYFALFGINEGTVRQVIVSGSRSEKVVSYIADAKVGALVALNKGTVSGCRSYVTFNYTATSSSAKDAPSLYIGGLVGSNEGSLNECQNYGEMEVSMNFTSTATGTESVVPNTHVGGVVGTNSGTLTQCDNNINIHATGGKVSIGGVVGSNKNSSAEKKAIYQCINYGEITSEAQTANVSAGGILGIQENVGGSICDCYNYGAVTTTSAAEKVFAISGGIVGYNRTSVTKCLNAGNIAANNNALKTSAYAGGIAGYNITNGVIHTSVNAATAKVDAPYYFGGITGSNGISTTAAKGVIYSCCSNYGTPLRWTSTGSDVEPTKDVDTSEHTDN